MSRRRLSRKARTTREVSRIVLTSRGLSEVADLRVPVAGSAGLVETAETRPDLFSDGARQDVARASDAGKDVLLRDAQGRPLKATVLVQGTECPDLGNKRVVLARSVERDYRAPADALRIVCWGRKAYGDVYGALNRAQKTLTSLRADAKIRKARVPGGLRFSHPADVKERGNRTRESDAPADPAARKDRAQNRYDIAVWQSGLRAEPSFWNALISELIRLLVRDPSRDTSSMTLGEGQTLTLPYGAITLARPTVHGDGMEYRRLGDQRKVNKKDRKLPYNAGGVIQVASFPRGS